jgi:hypothetical protein
VCHAEADKDMVVPLLFFMSGNMNALAAVVVVNEKDEADGDACSPMGLLIAAQNLGSKFQQLFVTFPVSDALVWRCIL